MKQPPRRNQPSTRNVLKYSGFHRAWLLHGEAYGIEYAGSILMFRRLEGESFNFGPPPTLKKTLPLNLPSGCLN